MSDLLGNALAWLEGKRHSYMTVAVVYRRANGLEVTIDATRGQTRGESVSEEGFTVETHARDYLVRASDLVFDGVVVKPADGDRILDTIDGVSRVYVVAPLGAEPAWRESDPAGATLRIHTRLHEEGEEGQV